MSDTHLGAPDLAEDELKERIALIESDPDAVWTFGGDTGELIRHNDRRYQPTSLHKRYRTATDLRYATLEHFQELFQPIADKLIGFAVGNHEKAMDDHNGGHFGVELCCNMGVEDRFVGYRGFVDLQVFLTKTQQTGVLVDLQHGWQCGRLKGAPQVQAERELGTTDADVVLRGHSHQPSAHTFVTLGLSGGTNRKLATRMRTVINGGTWRKGYRDDLPPVDRDRLSEHEGDLWHETKGYRAEPVGGPVLGLRFWANDGKTPAGRSRPGMMVEHTTYEGTIDAEVLGLAA